MKAVANGRLRYLSDQCLGIAQQQLLEFSTPREFILQHLGLHPQGAAGALYDGAVGHGAAAHEQRYPDHAIITCQTHFSARAVFHRVKQGDD